MTDSKHILACDLETFSAADITKVGAYRYVDDPAFQIMLMAYAFDDDPVQIIDLMAGEEIPLTLINHLTDPKIIKTAFNANFERTCLAKHTGLYMDPAQWRCTQIHASTVGLPRSLADVGKALKLPEDQQKMKEGKALIQYFCKPCKPTKTNGGRTRNYPYHAQDKWEVFKAYCVQDVETERVIRHRLEAYPVPEVEQKAWERDQEINDRGIMIDRQLAEAAVHMANAERDRLTQEAVNITRLDNPNSVAQLKDWLGLEESATLRKADLEALLGTVDDDQQRRVLEIRKELGKSSVKKYEAMLRAACHDDRVRGTMAYYKANRTGRWAGQLIQPQNFPQNHIDELDEARQMVLARDSKGVKLLFGSVNDTLSQLIRTAIVPRPGYTFAVADFAAIEARVIAWLAGEQWRQDTFASGGDIYCASASQMFHVPVEKHGVNGHLRQKGKIAELALGYGGGVGALTNMGALKMGLSENELPDIVRMWRQASPNIVKLWNDIENAAMCAVKCKGVEFRIKQAGLVFACRTPAILEIDLPSGRSLRYVRPKLGKNRFDGESITYEGNDGGKWGRCETFGGKLTENIVQALARDCLKEVLMDTDAVVFHVHDELICEVPTKDAAQKLEAMQARMALSPLWAPGLVLRGDGYLCDYYRKD